MTDFGFKTEGGDTYETDNYLFATSALCTVNGEAQSISVWTSCTTAAHTAKCALYNSDDKIIEVAKEKGIDAPKSGESFAEWSNRVGFYMKLSNEKRQEIIKEAEKRSTKKK